MNVAAENERAVIGGNNPPIPEMLSEQYRELLAQIGPIVERANSLERTVKTEDELTVVSALIVDSSKLSKRFDKARKEEKQPHLDAGKAVDGFFNPHIDRLERIADAFERIANDYQRTKIMEERRQRVEEARKLREAEERKRQEALRAKREETVDRKQDEADELAAKAADAEDKAKALATEAVKVQTDSGVKVSTKAVWAYRITDYDAIPLDRLRDFIDSKAVDAALKKFVELKKDKAALPGVEVFEDTKSSFRR